MSTLVPVKNAFNGGEVSPQVLARSDLPIYQHSVAQMQNWLPRPAGGMEKRPGSLHVWRFPDSTKKGRLIEFTYDRSKAFAILLQEYIAYIFLDGAPVLTAAQEFDAANVVAAAGQFETDAEYLPGAIFRDGHGPVRVSSTGALPAGLAADTDYWIMKPPESYFFDSGDVNSWGGDIKITIPNHRLTPRQGAFQIFCDPRGRFTATAAYLPANIESSAWYYVESVVDEDNFKITTTPGGAPVAYSDAGSGNFELRFNGYHDWRREIFFSTTKGGPAFAFGSQGTGVHTVTPQTDEPVFFRHPYNETEIWELSVSQIGDLMWITHGNHPPRVLTRWADWSWQLSYADIEDGPWLRQQEYEPGDNSHMIAALNTGINPAQDQPGTDIDVTANQNIWHASDIDRHLRISGEGTNILKFGWAIIREVKSPTVASVDIYATWTGANGASRTPWHLSPWSHKLGWPRLCSLHHQRVWYGSTTQLITHLWSTQAGSLASMAPDEEWNTDKDYPEPNGQHIVTDAGAITYAVMIDQVNEFNFILPLESLLVGSGGGILRLAASELEESLTPDNPRIERISKIGAAEIQPTQLDDAAIFVGQDGKTIFATIWDADRQKMRPHNLQRLTEHFSTSEVVQLCATPNPYSTFWACRVAGEINAVALDTRESVLAWSKQQLAPTAGGDAVVESICSLQGVAGGDDEVWMVVRRTINGATERHIERFAQRLGPAGDKKHGVYMDSAVRCYGVPISSISLPHLPNETVRVLVDGARHSQDVTLDSNGDGDLDGTYTDVCAGLPFRATASLLPTELPPQLGLRLSMKAKRIVESKIRLIRSLGISVGPTPEKAAPLSFRKPGAIMDKAPDLFTGVVEVDVETGFGPDGTMSIVSDGPFPAEVVEISNLVEAGTW